MRAGGHLAEVARVFGSLGWRAFGGPAVHTGTGLLPLALTFLKIGAIAFGSGYVLLPFLQADLVGGQFGLTDRQVLDAFAVSQATPGPVFGMAAFLGVQTTARVRLGRPDPGGMHSQIPA